MSMPGFTGEVSLYKTGAHYHTVAAEVRSTSQVMASTITVTGPLSNWWFTCGDVLKGCQLDCLLLPDNKDNKKINCLDCCGKKWDWCHLKGNWNWGIWWPYNSPPCDEP